jgi:hypothetical protein
MIISVAVATLVQMVIPYPTKRARVVLTNEGGAAVNRSKTPYVNLIKSRKIKGPVVVFSKAINTPR